MATDEMDLRDTARALAWLYQLLDARKYQPPPPKEARIMAPPQGPRGPVADWIINAEDCLLEERTDEKIPGGLRAMVMDAAEHVGRHPLPEEQRAERQATGAELCAFVALHAFYIVEKFLIADDLADLMKQQARWLASRLNPPQEAPKDPYLTAGSIQRTLAARSLECPEGTVRRWASEGHVATRKRGDGRTLYRLRDVQEKVAERSLDHD